ncbi:MAG TPA: nucleotide-binding protein [Pseudoxanthomonas sp.]
MNRKPRLFIGSSVEGLKVADAINLNLDHELEVTLWRTGVFDLASTAIDSLVLRAHAVDFAVFVFSPDDVAVIRSQQRLVVRDNVLFELGLFIGALGKERCFIVKPRNTDLHLPTDLLGVTAADYEGSRSDGDVSAAVNHACVQMKRAIERLGLLRSSNSTQRLSPIRAQSRPIVKQSDHYLLAKLAPTVTRNTGGSSLSSLESYRRGSRSQPNLDVSAIRLERAGLIERKIESDCDGNEYYAYSITDTGIEELLRLDENVEEDAPQGPADFADDIPF